MKRISKMPATRQGQLQRCTTGKARDPGFAGGQVETDGGLETAANDSGCCPCCGERDEDFNPVEDTMCKYCEGKWRKFMND